MLNIQVCIYPDFFILQVWGLTMRESWYLGQQTSHGPSTQPSGEGSCYFWVNVVRTYFVV